MALPVLRLAADLGPRFAAVRGRPSGWIPAAELFGTQLPANLTEVGHHLGATPAVAGTLFLQQYAAILAAPVVAALHLERSVLPCEPVDVTVDYTDGRPIRIAFALAARPVVEFDHAVADIVAKRLTRHLLLAAESVHRLTRAGRRLLQGAIAYEVALTFLHLSWRHPDGAHHLDDARRFLAAAGLEHLVVLEAVPTAGRRWLHAGRKTCCLAFRTADNRERVDPYCATCPVLPEKIVMRSFRDAVDSYVSRRR